jgi:hypothetical protein
MKRGHWVKTVFRLYIYSVLFCTFERYVINLMGTFFVLVPTSTQRTVQQHIAHFLAADCEKCKIVSQICFVEF